MAPTWEQVRGSNYGTMGRTVSGVVHRADGTRQRVIHLPEETWRYEDPSGDPTFIENSMASWSRDADGTMIRTDKSGGTFVSVSGGLPTMLLRAYDSFPPSTADTADEQRFIERGAPPRAVSVRGRAGWEVIGRDRYTNEPMSYVFDAELGVALRWQLGSEWLELEQPVLDGDFEADLFHWTGPSRSMEDEVAKMQRAQLERERAVANIPQAVPTWVPTSILASSQSGNPLTGELTLSVNGQSPQFLLRRWPTAIGEPALEWPNIHVKERFRQPIGDWTYEIRSHQEMDSADCARILGSIVPVEPPGRDAAEIVAEIADHENERRNAEVLATLGTGRVLGEYLDHQSLLVRTNFSDDNAWREIAEAAMTPVPQGDGTEFAAYLTCIDNREYDGMTVEKLLDAIGEPPPYYAFLVDAETVQNPDAPIVCVHTGTDEPERPRGRIFRVVPSEMHAVENNLSIANMDFEDFADNADNDGVFRGFA